jgi:hypothetical protein
MKSWALSLAIALTALLLPAASFAQRSVDHDIYNVEFYVAAFSFDVLLSQPICTAILETRGTSYRVSIPCRGPRIQLPKTGTHVFGRLVPDSNLIEIAEVVQGKETILECTIYHTWANLLTDLPPGPNVARSADEIPAP